MDKAVQDAVDAAAYGNEQGIGLALTEMFQSNTIDRSEVFVVLNFFNNSHFVNGEDRPRQALKSTLEDLQLE